MKLSTRGRYGTRFMMELAMNFGCGPVPLKEIASRQDVSKGYLEQITPILHGAGLIRSVRGPGGGYALAREPEMINLMEILSALEGPLDPVDCISNRAFCDRAEFCAPRDIWIELKEAISERLRQIRLSDLIGKQRIKMEKIDQGRASASGNKN